MFNDTSDFIMIYFTPNHKSLDSQNYFCEQHNLLNYHYVYLLVFASVLHLPIPYERIFRFWGFRGV